MQFQNVKISSDVTNVTAKIDQLLRLYQMSKKTDLSKKTLVQKKVYQLLSLIKDEPIYAKIQPLLTMAIKTALDDPKVASKAQRMSSNVPSIKSSNNVSVQKVMVSDASISNNNISQESSKSKLFNGQSMKSALSNPQASSQSKFMTLSNKNLSSEFSNEKSEENAFGILLDNLRKICKQYSGRVQEMIAINQDIFASIKQTEDNEYIYLFGINNPEKKSFKKFYICTLMKFSTFQILSNASNQGQDKYGKQYKMFQNNLRSPLGLIMCGKGINCVKIQHIKFLADMNSPLPVVILMQSFKSRNGLMYEFDVDFLQSVRQLNKTQYQQKGLDIGTKYGPKAVQLSKVEVIREKLVITKNLARAITNSIESAKNAIQIQSSSEFIKQQLNRFPYKMHTKYYVSPKSDYQLFFLDNLMIAFKMSYKEKQFDFFKKFVLEQAHHKGNYLLSTSVLKETSEIKKQFFRLLVECKTRDQFFLVNLSGISNKKTIILSLKENVAQDQIQNSPPILFKDLEKPTDIVNVVAVITKQNYKQFQTQNKFEVIDLTIKKK